MLMISLSSTHEILQVFRASASLETHWSPWGERTVTVLSWLFLWHLLLYDNWELLMGSTCSCLGKLLLMIILLWYTIERNAWNNQGTSWRDIAGRRFSFPHIVIIVNTVFVNIHCHTGRKEHHLSWRVCKSWRMKISIPNISIGCYHARWWYERKKKWLACC